MCLDIHTLRLFMQIGNLWLILALNLSSLTGHQLYKKTPCATSKRVHEEGFSILDNTAKLLYRLVKGYPEAKHLHNRLQWCFDVFVHGSCSVHLAISLVVKSQGPLHQTISQRGVWPHGFAFHQKTSSQFLVVLIL